MIRNVIFDLDGTLLDTREGILESVRYAAGQLGYPELPKEELLQFVGPPIQQSFMQHYGCDEETAQKAAGVFRTYYKTTALLMARPYEGIYALCETLKAHGLRMAVATYKREDYALTLLRHFRFDQYCDPMHGADDLNQLKKADIIQLCMKEMNAIPDECVLVGDTLHDAQGARDAGLSFIAVTYGFGFRDKADTEGFPCYGIAKRPLDVAACIIKGEA